VHAWHGRLPCAARTPRFSASSPATMCRDHDGPSEGEGEGGGGGALALVIASVPARLLPRVQALEAASYPASEAATPTQLAYRLHHAPELFLGAFAADGGAGDVDEAVRLLGFVCATLAHG